MRRISSALAGIAILCAALSATDAVAQATPDRPLKLIVPFPPGGSIDMLSRMLGERLAERLRQPVVVENKPGASGLIGAEFVARSAPDGLTLLTAPTSVYAVSLALNGKLAFDLTRDLAPLSLVAITEQVVNVNPAVPAATLGEFVAWAKGRPRALNMASQGNGTVSHLACAWLAAQSGIELTHVPYKGSAQAITDLVSGSVHVMCDSVAASLPQIRAGKLRALAAVGARRTPQLPEVPTVAEALLPGYKVESWTGLMAPGATPQPIVERLQQEIARIIADPALARRLTEAGFRPQSSTAEGFARQIRDDIAVWAGVVKSTGVTPE